MIYKRLAKLPPAMLVTDNNVLLYVVSKTHNHFSHINHLSFIAGITFPASKTFPLLLQPPLSLQPLFSRQPPFLSQGNQLYSGNHFFTTASSFIQWSSPRLGDLPQGRLGHGSLHDDLKWSRCTAIPPCTQSQRGSQRVTELHILFWLPCFDQ